MTRDEKNRIRKRDRYRYNKLHGPVPAGYTIHHLSYSETYDEDSFIIITKEEHELIHGNKIPASAGTDIMAYRKEYQADNKERLNERCREYYANNREERINHQREYYANNREKVLNYRKEYDKAHKEEIKERKASYYKLNEDKMKAYREQNKERRNEQSRIYNAKVKAVRMSFGLTQKQWRALTADDRKRLMDTFMENGGIT